jgi:hypothetical protein
MAPSADGAELTDAAFVKPADETAHGDGIGCARVGVADIGEWPFAEIIVNPDISKP